MITEPPTGSADFRARNPHIFAVFATPLVSFPPSPAPKAPSKTQARYRALLEARGEVIYEEAIKLKVGLKRCWYLPDFATVTDGRLTLHEVKGEWVTDDARVKFQSAARQYPCFAWVWAQWIGGEWRIERV